MKTNQILLATITASLFFVSCSKDDDTTNNTSPDLVVPATYEFKRDGVSTVNYDGQKQRLLMLEEMGNYMGGTNPVDEIKLKDMFTNTGNPFANAELNSSGKQLRDKTAGSADYFASNTVEQSTIRTVFENTFKDAQLASAGIEATNGVAGYYMDGTKKRYFDANGLEPQQVFLKGMMGALMMDQISNHYLGFSKLDAGSIRDNNTKKVVEAGKTYTTMEHSWDEAYGYIFGADNATATPAVYKYWSSYINQVNADSDFNKTKENIELAFRKGRAAIVANDYVTRDAQIAIIRTELAKVAAVRAVFYLIEGKAKLTTDGGKKAFHALSEGYGFIMALRFSNKNGTNAPYFTKEEVNQILADLTAGTNGLYDVDYLNTKLEVLAEKIATKFGFTVAQASVVN